MSKVVGDVFVAEIEPPRLCELCGAFEELRPYGPGGKSVCFTCAQKDPKTTERMLRKRLKAVRFVVDHRPMTPLHPDRANPQTKANFEQPRNKGFNPGRKRP